MRERFVELLDLARIGRSGEDVYLAAPATHGTRLFGGHVVAQALRAAAATVSPGRPAHALHAFYVRAGRSDIPVRFDVDRVRDGRSFSVRQVKASQQGDGILVLMASFQVDEHDEDWQPDGSMPAFDLPPEQAAAGTWLDEPAVLTAFEVRRASDVPSDDQERMYPLWVRSAEALPDDPVLHTCAVASACDIWIGATAASRRPHRPEGSVRASLDHSIWLHRWARADEWLLLSVAPLSTTAHRTLGVGSLHTRDGRRVATVAQEALARDPAPG